MRRRYLLLSVLLLFNSYIYANLLTIEKAIDYAMENSKEIKIAKKDVHISDKQVSIAFKNALPSINYNGVYVDVNLKPELPIPFWGNLSDSYISTVGISQPIFRGGSILNGIKGAKIGEVIATATFLKVKRDVRQEVIQIYSELLSSIERRKVQEASKKQLNTFLASVKERVERGMALETDILEIERVILETEVSIINEKAEYVVLEQRLKQKLGLDEHSSLEYETIKLSDELVKNIDFETDLNVALNESLDAITAKNSIDLAKIEKNGQIAEFLPKVNGYVGQGNVFGDKRDEDMWGGGVVVTWNLFQFGKDLNGYDISSEKLEQARLKEELVKDEIKNNLKKAYLNLEKQKVIKEAKEKAVEEALALYKNYGERYRLGKISLTDYLRIEVELLRAQMESIVSNNRYYVLFEKYRALLI